MNLIDNINVEYFNNVSNSLRYNEFNIFSLNIRSIRYKKEKLEDFLELLNVSVPVLVITETWLNSNECSIFNIKGYNAFNCTRSVGNGGGVSIFIKSDILVNEVLNKDGDG